MKFSAVLPSLNPKSDWFMQALESCRPFDEVLIHVEHKDKVEIGKIEKTNRLLTLATGDWFCFVSDDDWFDVEALKATIELAKVSKADIITTPYIQVEPNKTYVTGQKNIDDSIYEGNFINPASLVKRQVWEELKFIGLYAQDWIFWTRAYRKGYKFEYFDRPTYYHRVRKDSDCRMQYAEFGNNFEKYRQYFLKEVGAENENR